MGKDERILLSVAFVALVALVIARLRDAGDVFAGGRQAVNVRNFNRIPWHNVTELANVIQQSGMGNSGIPTSGPDSAWSGGDY